MSVNLRRDYRKGLLSAEPTFFGSHSVSPPPGAQGEERIEPGQIIPPINTDIDFNMLSPFKLSDHGGLSALSEKPKATKDYSANSISWQPDALRIMLGYIRI
jgi:hypothetical protein